MAYIVSVTQTATAVASTYTVTLGAHQSGDLLLVCLSQDGGGTAIAPDATSTTAGWAMIGTGAASQSCRGQWAYLIADSASEVNPAFTGANDDWIGTCLVIRDAHATAPLGSVVDGTDFKKADWGNSSSINFGDSGALTTAVDECLLIYSWCSDGATQYMRCKIDEVIEVDKYASSQINHIIGCRQQQTAAAAPTVRMYSPVATEGGTGWVLAIRNKSGGALQPDVRVTGTDWKWYGSWITQHDSVTWGAPNAFAASINSITCSSTAPTVDNTNAWAASSYGNYTILQSTESTSGAWVGGTHAVTSIDLTGKIVKLEMAAGHVSTGAVAGSEGWLIGFSDGTNWVVYQVKSRAKSWALQDPDSYWVAVGSATAYASSGTIASALSACTRIGFFQHRIGSPSTSTSQLHIKNLAYFTRFDLTGGGSARPATFVDLHNYASNWSHFRLTNIQGSAQIKPKVSVQVGDGTNKTYFDGATNAIGFPQAWSATTNNNWQMDWNVNSAIVTLGVKAGANDTIKLAAGAATSANDQLLTIASDSNSGATYDFAQAFGGFSVTWDTDIACSNATFTGGGQVLGKGADFTNCIFKNSTAGTTAAVVGFDANGASMTGCTTSATSSTGYHIELGTSVTAITLTDHTFTGSALTDKIHVLRTTDTVTITISGSTTLAADDVTTEGATVSIVSDPVNQVVIVSGFTAGSRIQIYDTTNATELFNGTASAGNTVVSGSTATWTDPAAATGNRAIRVRVAYVNGTSAKLWQQNTGLTCGTSSTTNSITYPITQVDDDTYNDNGINGPTIYATSGITFTDAATDLVNCNIAGGSVTWPTIYACFVYWLFTAAGIDDDVTYIDGVDTANYLLTAMKVRNTNAADLTITGGYGRSATTGLVADVIDTAGSTGNIFVAPDHVVAYATGSGALTAQDIQDIWAAASRTLSGTTDANIVQVGGATITGAGTEANPWGP